MLTLENTKENKALQQVAATMAIEDMYPSKDFLYEMVKVANGEKTSEELRQEVIKKYARY